VIIVADQLVLRRERLAEDIDPPSWRPVAFIAWVVAAVVSLAVNTWAPQLSVAVIGMVVAAVVYAVAMALAQRAESRERDATLN